MRGLSRLPWGHDNSEIARVRLESAFETRVAPLNSWLTPPRSTQEEGEDINTILTIISNLITLTGRRLFLIAFTSVVLALFPDSLLERLSLAQYREQYRSIINATALVTTLLVVASLVYGAGVWLVGWAKSRFESQEQSRQGRHVVRPELRPQSERDPRNRTKSLRPLL